MFSAPWASIFPGVAILVTVLAFNFVGDGLSRRARSVFKGARCTGRAFQHVGSKPHHASRVEKVTLAAPVSSA